MSNGSAGNNIDYHIAFDANFLQRALVEVRATPTTIEIFHKGLRVGSHVRGHGRGQEFTQREHRPKSHQITHHPGMLITISPEY